MEYISGNKIWRIVARVDDEIIIKESMRKERAIRSARNAVVQKLCTSVNINYEYGWWKGRARLPRVTFVDLFLGDALLVMKDDDVDIGVHNVPNQFYLVDDVRAIFFSGDSMIAENFDSFGYYHYGEGDSEKFPLLGRNITVPSTITGTKGNEKEEVIAICDAEDLLDCCPNCKGDVPFGTIMVVTENYRLLPTNCCNKMHWYRASDGFREEWA